MNALNNKKILVGVTGSIAAYKTCELVRLLVKAGADVQVIMTEGAKAFIAPLTLATLSGKPALSTFTKDRTGEWNNHVHLGLWADALVIAPASANTLAKCANGLCDNLLTAVYLSARSPVFFAPAMDLDMYAHPATAGNMERLRKFGNTVMEAGYGALASGLTGAGRMPEPEEIIACLEKHFSKQEGAAHRKVLITAGPTREAIDPVRFISNHSSGKMGYALARAFANAGAEVTLVSGPVNLPSPGADIRLIPVTCASEMYEAALKVFPECDLAIFAAAVADYTPKQAAPQKIKKKEAEFQLDLVKTKDIAATLGMQKKPHQLLMGFALETEHEMDNALGKLHKKQMDFIVLNSLNDPGAGFGHDTNKITVIDKNENVRQFRLKSKTEAADDLLTVILEQWKNS